MHATGLILKHPGSKKLNSTQVPSNITPNRVRMEIQMITGSAFVERCHMKWRSQKRVALFIVIAQMVKVTWGATVVEISENDIEIFGNFETFEKLGK